MAWYRTGDKPLSEPVVALFTDAFTRPSVPINLDCLLTMREKDWLNLEPILQHHRIIYMIILSIIMCALRRPLVIDPLDTM